MSPIERTVHVVILFVLGVLLPWWVSVPFAFYLSSRVVAYEIIPFGFMLDRLYGVLPSQFMGVPLPLEGVSYTFLVLFSLIFFVSIIAKRSLIFYVS